MIGHVEISGGNDTLNVGPGLNLALTFDTSIPELIETGASSYTVVGNTVYVADTSTFAAADAATANLTGAVAGVVEGALDKGFAERGAESSTNIWLEGVGSIGSTPGRGGASAIQDAFGGLALGADFGPDADTRFGAYFGTARGGVSDGSQTIDTDSLYAGIYGGAQLEDFDISGTVTAGISHGASTRVVANNTVATGLEQITGTGDSTFISPNPGAHQAVGHK